MEQITEKDILNGIDGRVWMNGQKRGNCKSFEGKLNLEFEDVDVPGDRISKKKYIGASGEGTMSEYKVDSEFVKMYAEGIKKGTLPEVKIVGKLDDPEGSKSQRVAFYGVKFNELTLLKYENKSNEEREIPFTFDDFDIIDTI